MKISVVKNKDLMNTMNKNQKLKNKKQQLKYLHKKKKNQIKKNSLLIYLINYKVTKINKNYMGIIK